MLKDFKNRSDKKLLSETKKKKDTKLHSSEEVGMVSVERWNFNWTKKDSALWG